MRFVTDYKTEDFILGTKYEELPDEVKERLKGCLVDLVGALVSGTLSEQFAVGVRLATTLFGKGDVAVIGSEDRFSFAGAASAMGHSSNAYDIDDGHNLTRAHPGTSFIGALLAAAYERDITLLELYEAMLVAYEVTIRSGAAIMDYYNFAHSSGTFGAVGVVAGVGRIYGFTREEMNNALSVAEFNAPLVPGIRSVEYPSMNKDGVPFGVMIGVLAVLDSMAGFTGNKNLLESDEHRHYTDNLGETFEVMNLYFKPYPCCRWAHPAIDAVTGLMREHGIEHTDLTRVVIKTFNRATLLSKIEPKSADDAQYNIAYPVATAIVKGDFSIGDIMPEAFLDVTVLDMMKKLEFVTDDALDALFPARRICRAEIYTKDGRVLVSPDCEPRGEAHERVSVSWLVDKFHRITAPVLNKEGRDRVLAAILGDVSLPVRALVDLVNKEIFGKDN